MESTARYRGFTIVEVLIAVLFVGLAITALLAANQSFTIANGVGADLSTAEFLVEQVRELTAMLHYDDLDDFDGAVFSPPIAADRTTLANFPAFTQQVVVENVSQTNFDEVVDDGSSDFVRVTVTVQMNSKDISSASWIRARY